MDILIVVFLDVGMLPPKQREEYAQIMLKRMPKHDRITYFVMPTNYSDVKVIPVKCYLEGNVPESPDNIEELVKELRDLTQQASV